MVAETAVHRWDAQGAGGNASPIAPEVASDGIDEYTEVGLRFSGSRPNRVYPAQSLHLHCTDTALDHCRHHRSEAEHTAPYDEIEAILTGENRNTKSG